MLSCLGLHWLIVLSFAIPYGDFQRQLFRFELPIPILDTHQGEFGVEVVRLSPVKAYVEITNTRQQWEMFTNVAQPEDLKRLGIGYQYRDGSRRFVLFSDPDENWVGSWCRRRYTERALLELRNQSAVPHAATAAARWFDDGRPLVSASAMIVAATRVLREPDGTDAPLFQDGAHHLERTEGRTHWAVIAEWEIPLEELR